MPMLLGAGFSRAPTAIAKNETVAAKRTRADDLAAKKVLVCGRASATDGCGLPCGCGRREPVVRAPMMRAAALALWLSAG